MVEPITGALVAGALSAGATELAKGMLGEAAGDAYAKLKTAVSRWVEEPVEPSTGLGDASSLCLS